MQGEDRKNQEECVEKMDKCMLQEYVDACELIRETEQDIRKLNRKKGVDLTNGNDGSLLQEQGLLEQRKVCAERIRFQIEAWMLTIPVRMQRIVRYRHLAGLSWEQVAVKMGRNATAESVRKEYQRFIR